MTPEPPRGTHIGLFGLATVCLGFALYDFATTFWG
jgi:hypothetical protein